MKLGDLIKELEDLRDTIIGVDYDTEVEVRVANYPGDTLTVDDVYSVVRSKSNYRNRGTVVIEASG